MGYHGFLVPRMPEEESRRAVGGGFLFLWLAEGGGEKALPPEFEKIELHMKNSSRESVVLLGRLDYLL